MTEPSLQPKPPRLARWAIFVAIMALLITVLLWNDAALDSLLWRSTRWVFGEQDRYVFDQQRLGTPGNDLFPWYRVVPPLNGGKVFHKVERIVWVFRDFGEYYMTLILAAAVMVLHAKRWRAAVTLLASTAVASGIGALVGMIAGRLRPNGVALNQMFNNPRFPFLSPDPNGPFRNDGYNFWEFLRGLHGGGDLSFPSGHATLAFATAACLGYLVPRGRCVFLVVAAGCAWSRVILQAHFYSDALAGATIGLTIGMLVTVIVDKLLSGKAKV